VHELLAQLVAIDSVSSRSNLAMLDVLEPRLEALGFAVERQTIEIRGLCPRCAAPEARP